MAIDGFLNLDKPKGKTSSAVVVAIRKISGERRVGHGGTLDPEATGVLPICIGRGTRLAKFFNEARKTYRAEIEFGISTDTYDATGKITGRGDTSQLNEERIKAILASFKGLIEQIPPMYSAIKYKGKPLYWWARNGHEVQRMARMVEFYRLEISKWELPLLVLDIECSKGAYIRSLAHDVGLKLGCGAHLRGLVRLSCGPFHINEGISLSQLENACREGFWSDFVRPIDTAVLHLPAVEISDDEERALINGRHIIITHADIPPAGLCRSYSRDGRFIAILSYDIETGSWRPDIVLGKKDEVPVKR